MKFTFARAFVQATGTSICFAFAVADALNGNITKAAFFAGVTLHGILGFVYQMWSSPSQEDVK